MKKNVKTDEIFAGKCDTYSTVGMYIIMMKIARLFVFDWRIIPLAHKCK